MERWFAGVASGNGRYEEDGEDEKEYDIVSGVEIFDGR
jgi:hypothetical protein